jgi:uncharacterized membrane protein YphA (DoxX/SURF4 family)
VQPATISKQSVWVGRVVSAIPVLALLFSGSVKLMKVPGVVEGFVQFGYPASLIPVIGILEIACPIIYVIPRTAVLGAILMTGFLGGAIASNVRLNNPLFWVPLVLGVLAWGGLYLRDSRVRALIPLRH